MTLLRWIFLLQFTTTFALGQVVHQSGPPTRLATQPEAVVRSLYSEVIARHPIGIPDDASMKVFAPYLSKALLRRIDVAIACSIDYSRQHQRRDEKPPFDWLELGLFSGGNEEALPRAFHVESTQAQKDGSYRVYVRLAWGAPLSPFIWHVAGIVVRENGHFIVDDVVFLKDKDRPVESPLSKILAAGCDGPRWVGYSDERDNLKQRR